MHFGKITILTGGRGICEEAVLKITRACPVQLGLGHVTCLDQLDMHRGLSVPGSHLPQSLRGPAGSLSAATMTSLAPAVWIPE